MLTRYTVWVPIIAALLAPPAWAFDNVECTEAVRACLSRSKSAKDECFRSLASSPTCVGSEMGNIVSKRAQLSSAYPDAEEAGPGFLGPQILDRPCVDAFDTRLRTSVLTGTPSSAEATSLSRFIDRCVQPSSPNLYRP